MSEMEERGDESEPAKRHRQRRAGDIKRGRRRGQKAQVRGRLHPDERDQQALRCAA